MNKIKLIAGVWLLMVGLFMLHGNVDAATCSKVWNGKTYSYTYGPTGSSGTFTFTNWANTQYNISIHVVGKTTVCLSQTDFNNMMSWSYNSDASAFWSKNLDSWSRTLSCGNTHTYSRVHVPVNGDCGPADGATYTSAPDTGLCDVGAASSVNVNQSTYTWSCAGQYGGTTAQCSANKGNNGQSDGSSSGGGGGDGGGTPAIMTDVECVVTNSLPNIGETITYSAAPHGGGPNFSFSWTGSGLSGNDSQLNVTKNTAALVTPIVTVTDGKPTTITKTCPTAEFIYRPIIGVVPPITANTCTLTWDTEKLPGAICKVYADGMEKVGLTNNSPVQPGAKYQVRCTYTPEGGTATTTVSEIKACVKNPSLIEI